MKYGISGIMGCLLVLVSFCASAGTIAEYTADLVVLNSGKVESTTRIFVSGDKMRFDMPAQPGMGAMTTLALKGAKKMYIIMHNGKGYVESPLTEEGLPGVMPMMRDVKVEKSGREKLGAERVQGYDAVKCRLRSSVTMMGKTTKITQLEWVAPEFDIPLRSMQEGTPTSQELRNIKVGQVDASLFVLPAGYKKAKDMQALMMEAMKRGGNK